MSSPTAIAMFLLPTPPKGASAMTFSSLRENLKQASETNTLFLDPHHFCKSGGDPGKLDASQTALKKFLGVPVSDSHEIGEGFLVIAACPMISHEADGDTDFYFWEVPLTHFKNSH